MPIFEYRCLSCPVSYEVFHNGREKQEDVVCPSCGSRQAKKLISLVAVATHGKSQSVSRSEDCENGGGCCRGGMCQMN